MSRWCAVNLNIQMTTEMEWHLKRIISQNELIYNCYFGENIENSVEVNRNGVIDMEKLLANQLTGSKSLPNKLWNDVNEPTDRFGDFMHFLQKSSLHQSVRKTSMKFMLWTRARDQRIGFECITSQTVDGHKNNHYPLIGLFTCHSWMKYLEYF